MATAAASSEPPPPLLLAVRGRNGCHMLEGPGNWRRVEGWSSDGADNLEFDLYGNAMATYSRHSGRAEVWNPNTRQLLYTTDVPKVIHVQLSPKGSFLVLWTSPKMTTTDVNCFVHDVSSGAVTSLYAPMWPCLQWASDESIVFFQKPSGITLHNSIGQEPVGAVQAGKWTHLSVSVSCPPAFVVAAVPPEKQREETPTSLSVFRWPKVDKVIVEHQIKLDDAKFLWNRKGTACILNASLDHDTTGRSYYGESTSFVLQLQDKKVIPLKTGRQGIHDIQWAPSGAEFIIVYGQMPDNKATIFNEKGMQLHNFEIAPRNTVCWSPHTRFVGLAGFGNLPGDVEIWDRNHLSETSKAKLGCFRMSSVTRHQWSPDSRHILCATCHPRMTTGNQVAIYKHNGESLYQQKFDEIYEATWVPRHPRLYPVRDPSPPPRGMAAAKPAPKAAAFRAAGSRAGGALADSIRSQMSASQTRSGGYAGLSSRPGAGEFGNWRDGGAPKETGPPGATPVGAPEAADKKKKKPKPKAGGDTIQQIEVEDFKTKEYPDVEKALKNRQQKMHKAGNLRNKEASELTPDQRQIVANYTNLKEEIKYLQALKQAGQKSQP